jgi:hypothetical protein
MELWWWVASAVGALIILALCIVICCSFSRSGYPRELNLDDVPPVETLPSYPLPVDGTGKYPLPPPCDPSMIPPDFVSCGEKFPSVTDRITTDYFYIDSE